MSIRNLDKLFKPRSAVLIGATPRPGSVGAVVLHNLRRAGFAGELMLVNPHHRTIDGLTVHPDIASLPRTPDLAVITTPPETVPGVIGELAARGTRAAIVITAGFGELGEHGRGLQQAALDAARPQLLRIGCRSSITTGNWHFSPSSTEQRSGSRIFSPTRTTFAPNTRSPSAATGKAAASATCCCGG